VNSFGMGEWSHNSAYRTWFEAYVSTDEASLIAAQHGELLNVGAYVKYLGKNENTRSGEGLFLGRKIEPAYFLVEFTIDENVHGETIVEERREIQQIAFFMDVKRADGKIDRLWLKNGNHDFTVAEILKDASGNEYPESYKSLGAGMLSYVLESSASPIYNQRRACR
jgi:hypothetical protein